MVQMMLRLEATRSLFRGRLASATLDAQRMQAVFDAAVQELRRSTAALSTRDAQHLLMTFWPGYVPEGAEPNLN